ncbi:MAG: hypothetical protein LC109_03385 [Bacteroidia bacterium]|nr:hypothetical protein [Bacteroidia bacterium]
MRHFILTSTSFTGQIEYKYCNEGYLISFKNEAALSAVQREKILVKMPLTIAGFNNLIAISKTLTVQEIEQDLGFDSFWNLYDKKINRKRCEPLWNKLKDADRLRCMQNIPVYKRYLQRTNFRAQKDPDGYLRDRLFETEWNKIN